MPSLFAERPLTLVREAQPLYYARMYMRVWKWKGRTTYINLSETTLICWCQHSSFELAVTLKLSHYSVTTFSTKANANNGCSCRWYPDCCVRSCQESGSVCVASRESPACSSYCCLWREWEHNSFECMPHHGHIWCACGRDYRRAGEHIYQGEIRQSCDRVED